MQKIFYRYTLVRYTHSGSVIFLKVSGLCFFRRNVNMENFNVNWETFPKIQKVPGFFVRVRVL